MPSCKRVYENFSAENLENTAADLFYRKGYGVALAEILDAAGIYKATFYKYYDCKEQLAVAYIERKQRETESLLRGIMQKRPAPGEFSRSWTMLLEKSAGSAAFYGCPFSNLFAQTLRESPSLSQHLRAAIGGIIRVLSDYVAEAQSRGLTKNAAPAAEIAMAIFTAYEGAMTMFNLTGDAAVFAQLRRELQRLTA